MSERSLRAEIFLACIRFVGVYFGLIAIAQITGHPAASTISYEANINMLFCSLGIAIGWWN